MSSIAKELTAWDGKQSAVLEELYRRQTDLAHFTEQITVMLSSPQLQSGASWLLKHHLEQGGRLTADCIAHIYAELVSLEAWEAKLHVLQCLPKLPIPDSQILTTKRWLEACLAESNKFVRAWTYNGFYELARQHPRYRPAVIKRLQQAQQTEPAASVQARIRRCLKQGF